MIKLTCEYFYSTKKQVINMAPVFKMGLSAQQAMVGRIMSPKDIHVLIPRT